MKELNTTVVKLKSLRMLDNDAICMKGPQKQTGKGKNLIFGGGKIIEGFRKTSETKINCMS